MGIDSSKFSNQIVQGKNQLTKRKLKAKQKHSGENQIILEDEIKIADLGNNEKMKNTKDNFFKIVDGQKNNKENPKNNFKDPNINTYEMNNKNNLANVSINENGKKNLQDSTSSSALTRVKLEWKEGGKNVFVAGSYNDWKISKMAYDESASLHYCEIVRKIKFYIIRIFLLENIFSSF